MSKDDKKEIREERDWLGRKKWVVYEDGKKIAETRREEDWLGRKKQVTIDPEKKKIAETKRETDVWGREKFVTIDPETKKKISETKYEKDWLGRTREVIYEDGDKIGELRRKEGFLDGIINTVTRRKVLREAPGYDVDLARRGSRGSYSGTGSSSRGLPIPGIWLILAVVGFFLIILIPSTIYGVWKIGVEPNLPWVDPLTAAYDGAFRWADSELPNERSLNLGKPCPNCGSVVFLLKSEVVDAEVVGTDSWAFAYYGCDRQQYDTTECRKNFPGTGYIIHSANRGSTWEIQREIANWVPLSVTAGAGRFIDETHGYAFGDTGILYTNDGGKYWDFRKLPVEVQEIVSVKLIQNERLVVECRYGPNKQIGEYESLDAGRSWQKITAA